MKRKHLHAVILVTSFLLAGIQPAIAIDIPNDDPNIGTWTDATTYTLANDLYEGLVIVQSSFTLDGAGYSVTGAGAGYGVHLSGRTGVTIQNLIVTGFHYGIWLDGSNNNELTNNTTSNNERGILLWGYNCYSNTLTGNSASYNSNGIWLDGSNNNELTGNTASNNDNHGICLISANYNTVTDNTASNNNRYGIYLNGSSGNVLSRNTVEYNNSRGIYLKNSSNNNTIYNNNFIDNKTQAYIDGGSGNVFSLYNPAGGNYWSNWCQPDNNGDGFVDSPYVFNGGQDTLPWTVQDGWPLNEPPVADAGGDQTVYAWFDGIAEVTLDGSGSTDPDSTPGTNNDIEFFDWYEGDTLLGSGETLKHTFPLGTHTVSLVVTDSCEETDEDKVIIDVLVPPVAIYKGSAIDKLEGAKNGDKKIDKEVDKAIGHINKSLGIGEKHDLWLDDSHLDPKHGKKVFDEEKKAVKELMHLMDKKHTPEMVKYVCQVVVDYLIEADCMLAVAAYEDAVEALNQATDPKVIKKIEKELDRCDKEFEKAEEELNRTKKDGTPDPHYDKAIDHYKHAWEHAQKALKKLRKLEVEEE